jgi:cystathionine beta-lyase family protein involved in aluminum resistance
MIWKANGKAWMTSSLFEEWLKMINSQFAKQNRKVLLFVDNCSSHTMIELSNIEICFLPPNSTF